MYILLDVSLLITKHHRVLDITPSVVCLQFGGLEALRGDPGVPGPRGPKGEKGDSIDPSNFTFTYPPPVPGQKGEKGMKGEGVVGVSICAFHTCNIRQSWYGYWSKCSRKPHL